MLSLVTECRPPQREGLERSISLKRGPLHYSRFLLKMAHDRIEDTLDCEKAFEDFISQVPAPLQSRYIRYNIELDDLPTLDHVNALSSLQLRAREHLFRDCGRIQSLALQILASSFYFETERVQQFSSVSSTEIGRAHV